jgi:hypothetical protein
MGYPITVFTDQTNYAFNGLKPLARVVRWVLLLEEYGVQFQYIIGRKNVGFYALSRLDMEEITTTVAENSDPTGYSNGNKH